MQSESEHQLKYLLILSQQRHRDQTEALKFIGLTATQETPLAIYSATWEIMVYTTRMWNCTLPAFPHFPTTLKLKT